MQMLKQWDRFSPHIIFFGPAPEIGSSCIAGDVEHCDALEAGQRDGPTITLTTDHSPDQHWQEVMNIIIYII